MCNRIASFGQPLEPIVGNRNADFAVLEGDKPQSLPRAAAVIGNACRVHWATFAE